jgi:branched-chain amino acid transport system substrate-binding protein
MTGRFPLALVSAVCLALVAASCGGGGARTIKIGVIADCEGLYGFSGEPSYAGAELPLIAHGARPLGPKPSDGISGAEVAGRRVQLVFGCGDDTAAKTLSEARRLVEQDGVDVLIGPTQIGESFPIGGYARLRPQTTFVDGSASGQALTLNDPAPNFFRFSTDGAQWSAGLGWYAYRKLGWRRAVTVAEDEGFEYTQVAGFVAEFCALGGTIVKRFWSPAGDVSSSSAGKAADGFYVVDPGNFTNEFKGLRGPLARRILGGIFWGTPQNSPVRGGLERRAVGVVSGQPVPSRLTGPASSQYRAAMHKAFPDQDPSAQLIFPIVYYDSMQAVVKALEQVHGDLSGGQRRFQAALAKVRLDSPLGPIRLDPNRQAVGANYLDQYQNATGGIVQPTIRVVLNVDQTFGGYFHTNRPVPSRTYPPCRHGNPPSWARSG